MYRRYDKDEFYTRRAHQEGYPARSIYKLQEIDEKYHLFFQGAWVLDLGCAPGSWLLYISKKVGLTGKVVGVDHKKLEIPLPSNVVFVQRDVIDFSAEDISAFAGKFNSVVSDLAPQTSGVKIVDRARSLELSQKAWEIAKGTMAAEASFVCKILEGGETNEFFKEIEKYFKTAKRFRPKAVRKGSREIYFIGKESHDL